MTTIPDDIQRAIAALAAINQMPEDAYCNRWWADVRRDVAMRGGIEAVESEAAAMTTTTTEEPAE